MNQAPAGSNGENRILFWGCFMSLIATAFGFVVRTMVINEWGIEFGLSETQKGEIFGVGLWPFALSIVLFSLVIDKIGYGRAMVFAFVCHVSSAILTIFAGAEIFGGLRGYWMLYIGTFIVALGNGTVEAVINPVVATMYPRDKAKWLNILHAGWPGGLVIGGLMALMTSAIGGGNVDWRWKVGLILVPTLIYAVMLLGRRFPIHERVAAGIPYRAMLQEVGVLGALIVVTLMTFEVGRVFEFHRFGVFSGYEIPTLNVVIIVVLVGAFGAYVRTLGQPLFVFLLLIMMPLATTELGTDTWITPLMEQQMAAFGLPSVLILIYTSFIMMVLRFFAGPIIHQFSPLGLLAISAAIAAVGLTALSVSTGIMILLAATLYGFGKTFFWPTMLGVVAEQFPKGGALTLNTIAGVGMLSVGIVGAVFMGYVQDTSIERQLEAHDQANNTQFHANYVTQKKLSIFGEYMALDQAKVLAASEDDRKVVSAVTMEAQKGALRTVAILPVIMLACYLILIFYFRSKGGYKPVHLETQESAGSA